MSTILDVNVLITSFTALKELWKQSKPLLNELYKQAYG